jgi:hypothetical protein
MDRTTKNQSDGKFPGIVTFKVLYILARDARQNMAEYLLKALLGTQYTGPASTDTNVTTLDEQA